jgi:hypothetical protein
LVNNYQTWFPLNKRQALVLGLLPSELDGRVSPGVGVVVARLLLPLVPLGESADRPHDGGALVERQSKFFITNRLKKRIMSTGN